MFDIAYHCGTAPVQIQDISRRQNISQRYLEQIFQSLRKAQILQSKRGPLGGYMLARSPEKITLQEIIAATEGDLLLVECSTSGRKKIPCRYDRACVTQTVWQEASDNLQDFFSGLTLQNLCERGELLGLPRESENRLMYHI
jgi:Rrf2 family protein